MIKKPEVEVLEDRVAVVPDVNILELVESESIEQSPKKENLRAGFKMKPPLK
jgi:hypothetical protein